MNPDGPSRFITYLSSIASGHTDPVMGTYPGLNSERWYDASQVAICAVLEDDFARLRDEILALPTQIYYSETEPIERSGAWTIFPILELGRRNVANAARLPTVAAIAEAHGAIQTLAGGIYVSKLAPGAAIAAHRGPTNTRIRCHLGIQIPDGDCAIEIEGERRSWTEGACLVINDHLEHQAWNRTNQERIILVVDVWHPDLHDLERTLLTGLHVYADVQSVAISTWHQRKMQSQTGPQEEV